MNREGTGELDKNIFQYFVIINNVIVNNLVHVLSLICEDAPSR